MKSRALSKYILQHVMEYLELRQDGFKIRSICKKLKESWDMHLLRLNGEVKTELYQRYSPSQIAEGEESLKQIYLHMTTEDGSPQSNFCLH